MSNMGQVGIRELKQNASAVIAAVVAGDAMTITVRGRPVARMVPIGRTRLEELEDAGLIHPPTRFLLDLPRLDDPRDGSSPANDILRTMRDDERY